MLSIKLYFLLFLMICRVSNCQRRIKGGAIVSTDKPYVVYLVKASLSERNYDYWLCGGAIITSEFIITSAACVEDVKYLYAVAGYNKYVTNSQLDEDRCTQSMKKKIVFTCVPISYEFDFDRIEKWAQIDIALAKVESPYDFEDTRYLDLCSYIPKTIIFNTDPKYQEPDTDCVVMGWGHEKKWRHRKDTKNYNSQVLRYAATLIIDKQACLNEYKYYPKLTSIIEQYMICTLGNGTFDDDRPTEKPDEPDKPDEDFVLLDGCSRRLGQQNSSCNVWNNRNQNIGYMNIRREIPRNNGTYHYNYTTLDYIKDARNKISNRTRRSGICQNDHGGPLVISVGSAEVLIGVASVFKIDDDYNCIGPYLHTSTQRNAAFIDCVLHMNRKKDSSRNTREDALCDSPPNVRGFEMVENHISWKDHPAGPAQNELNVANIGP